MKKFIAFVLALTMVLGVGATISFGQSQEPFTNYVDSNLKNGPYDRYIAFGDSMSRGVGVSLTAYDYSYRNVYSRTGLYPGSLDGKSKYATGAAAYTYLLSEAVGCLSSDMMADNTSKYYPLCYNSLSAAVMVDLLGIELYDKDAHEEMLRKYGKQVQPLMDMYATGTNLTVYYENASYTNLPFVDTIENVLSGGTNPLITLNIGLADVVMEPILKLEELHDLSASDLADFAGYIKDAFLKWENDYARTILRIKALSGENATVALIGYFNPLSGLRLTNQTVLPLGDIITPYINLMNKFVKDFADKYDWCVYVDVSNADTMVREDSMPIADVLSKRSKLMDYIHLTPNGQRYVARQVISALEDYVFEKQVTKAIKYDITVDFAREDLLGGNVTVKVNGVPVFYKQDGTVITIDCNNPYATTLSILIDKNGDTYCAEYILVYEEDHYGVYKVYNTNNLGATEAQAEQNIKDVTAAVVDATVTVIGDVNDAVIDAIIRVNQVIRNANEAAIDKAQDAFEYVPDAESNLASVIQTGRSNVAKEVREGFEEVATDLLTLNYGNAIVHTLDAIDDITDEVLDARAERVAATKNLVNKVVNGWRNFLDPTWSKN